ncbi:uncharacterized protein LOC120007270 [Tripterygium wilfordii]|uniref:uncharacterized protein LOC120007270 n=1 Tax=Tripterygium wilfordii TaxID=458696 RepID=UPI0018F8398F|nr:uncharacterized protein LOC120007270 [Tripterygium wilfordii]
MEELDDIQIHPDYPNHKVQIGAHLEYDIRAKLIEFLTENQDCFAWSHADMVGIDPEVVVHRLRVDPNHEPVRQKRRKFAPELNRIINDEVQKLIDVGSVREDPFPLPHIDILVDSTAGHELLSFMDAFSGYNQILMHPDDQEKTSFITKRGSTYQRLVNKMFTAMLGKTMEVYIDDMLVKSLKAESHLEHLREAFEVLRKSKSGSNSVGPPYPISDIRKDVQKLTGRVVALSRFISRSSDGCHNFFSILHKNKDFEWSVELEEALRQLKHYLVSAPLLSKPKQVREEDGRQLPVYYVSKSLLDAETSEHDIVFQPRTTMKSQVLADFVADFTPPIEAQAKHELLCLTEHPEGTWFLSVDGSSNMNGSGLGVVLTSPSGEIMQQSIRCGFRATNNEAEYEALIAGLELAKELKVRKIFVRSDSQLVVNQLLGTYQARGANMMTYLELAKKLRDSFEEFVIAQVPRLENSHADALANLGFALQKNEPQIIPVVHLEVLATEDVDKVLTIFTEDSWMTPLIKYIDKGELLLDKKAARRLRAGAVRFTIYDGQLYRKSYSGPLLRCVTTRQGGDILLELHEGEWGNHSSGRSLANRTLTSGYFWPTMRADAANFVRLCSHHGPSCIGEWILLANCGSPPDKGFGIPKKITTDNGSQFLSDKFQKRLEDAKGKWAEEILGVLWSYRTTAKTPTGETPFSLVYGSEEVIPVEIGLPSARCQWISQSSNDELLEKNLDTIDELREEARIRTAIYQQKMAHHYNKNVRTRIFRVGDFVLRKVFQNTKEHGAGKLGKDPIRLGKLSDEEHTSLHPKTVGN